MAQDEKAIGNTTGRQAVAAPAITLPKGGGAIRGIGEKFGANPVTGTASLSVPLGTSPGRSAFGPELSLTYDSGSGNGPFGFGWSLSLPAISRKTDKGLPRYRDGDESDVYILSGAEDLVPVLRADGSRLEDDISAPGYTIHRYRPRIEGLFARIERWTSQATGAIYWRSITRDNVTSVYGRTAQSRIADDRNRVFSWLICESRDDKGNAIVYEYEAEDDENIDWAANERNRSRTSNRYLKRIKYGNRISHLIQPDLTHAEWMFEVVLDYDEGHYEEVNPDAGPERHRLVRASSSRARAWTQRPDPFSSYRAGFEVRTYRRCHRVLMFHRFAELGNDPYLVRATEFAYNDLPDLETAAIEGELAHHGSTRFASFICAVTPSGFVRDEEHPAIEVDGVRYVVYRKKSLPPLELDYSKAVINDTVHEVQVGLDNLPAGIDGGAYQWVDLDGEGVSGVLTEQADAWWYKPGLGDAGFGPQQLVAEKPSLAALGDRSQHLLDLAGDGQLDVVLFGGATPGFFERTPDNSWRRFTPFEHLPAVAWDDPNLRFVDLTGDGHADVLITDQEVFTCYPSLAEEGFGPAQQVRQPPDEDRGPRLVLDDGTQSVYLADMSGDGLSDLVRVRNGEVCYWPNVGYGSFGAKVTMDNAPWFDLPDQFSQQRIRLADIDGSGVADIIYLGGDGVRLYFNQSGNRWSNPRRLRQFPQVDSLSSITTADLLGNGTGCLVWSSPLPGDVRRPTRYIDLMGGYKPHLLVKWANNLGTEVSVHYESSTTFYLADKRAGHPWVTRIPFPVHVVERIETFDRISGNRFVTRYAYHHGYFDGVEREFRGFGRVDQWDTEEFAALAADQQRPTGTNVDETSHVPPVLTCTWFHTGVHFGLDHVSRFFAGLLDARDEGEYYREPGLSDADARALLLDDTILPDGLTPEEDRQACRALKGHMLRQEVYALDPTPAAQHPYSVTEQNFTLRCLQPKAGNSHAVFLAHARETITYHYERNPLDPRIAHRLTLETDSFGNVLKEAVVGYGRRQPDMTLARRDRLEQGRTLVTYTENSFTNSIDEGDAFRTPLPCESRTFELTGLVPPADGRRYSLAEVLTAGTTAPPIPYERIPTRDVLQKRPMEHMRTLYRRDNLAGPLPLGELQALGLPFESYRLAATPGLVAEAYGGRVSDGMLADDGRYVHSAGDDNWWVPSGRVFVSPDPASSAHQELAYARQHFFRPHRYRNPFHTDMVTTESFVTYDGYDLLVQETRDALGNRVTAGERDVDPTQPLTRQGLDYRVLQPALVMDSNRNCTAVAFDALGMVAGTAMMGKPWPAAEEGDSLDGFEADLTEAVIIDYTGNHDALPDPLTILARATTRLVYDLSAYVRTKLDAEPQPAVVYTLARETHHSDPVPATGLKIQRGFSYSDGFGREIQKKLQAEPGPVPRRGADGRILVDADGQPEMTSDSDPRPRWVGSGWTVFNNKGKPVRQYEPFFTDRYQFESDVRIGVSPVLFYDPVNRVVATLHPNHTWEKVIFNPWRQETWDINDTILVADPKTDPDVGDFFRRLPESAYLPSWHSVRAEGGLGSHEQGTASSSAVHANTPTVAHVDSLGRTFVTVAHNRFKYSDTPEGDPPVEEFHPTRIIFDIEGNQRQIVDALDRLVMRYDYDMLGTRIHQSSMEAGGRWTLTDVAGSTLCAWDGRDHQFRTVYDQLRRPIESYLAEGAGPELLVERIVYGESRAAAEAHNLRGTVVELSDQSGMVRSDEYDFKGNLLRSQRQLATEYKVTLDWSVDVPMEPETYTRRNAYDALNRPTELTTPDDSVIRYSYNEANLLNAVEVNLRGERANGKLAWVAFVSNIDYDAKGRRRKILYGNGVSTTYEYDPLTFRLTRLVTTRDPLVFLDDCPAQPSDEWPGCDVQNLSYTYDPAGNVTHIQDDAQQTVYFLNRRVEPSADYTYDAIYRLLEATGREHLGQHARPTPPDAFNLFHGRLDHPGDGSAMGRYIERYVYDAAGNILEMRHPDPVQGWVRTYAYNEPSQLEPEKVSNRLSRTTIAGTEEPYRYEGSAGRHGCMTSMPHLPLMQWDHRDQLRATAQQVANEGRTPETTWYVYDAAGQRVRKVTERQAAAGQMPSRLKERVYLGGFEVYREYDGLGRTVTVSTDTLHVMDDKQRIALVETRSERARRSPARLIRYQFGSHLGSSTLELDDEAQIISYEEYYPYGSTSYQAVRGDVEVTAKRYRHTGMERDEETGLNYHGARYYAPWLGRWTSCDPAGLAAGSNLYVFVSDNPVKLMDPTGMDGWPPPWMSPEAADFIETAGRYAGRQLRTAVQTVVDPFDLGLVAPMEAAAEYLVAGGGARGSRAAAESMRASVEESRSPLVAYARAGGGMSGLQAAVEQDVTNFVTSVGPVATVIQTVEPIAAPAVRAVEAGSNAVAAFGAGDTREGARQGTIMVVEATVATENAIQLIESARGLRPSRTRGPHVTPDVYTHEVFRSKTRGPKHGSTSPGYDRRSARHQRMLERSIRWWGRPGPVPTLSELDLGHRGTPLSRLRPGQQTTLHAQLSSENRSIGAKREKTERAEFERRSRALNLDPHDPKNPRYVRPRVD